MTDVRLQSNNLVHTPGIIRMARHEYAFGGKQAQWAINLLSETYFAGNQNAARYVLDFPEMCEVDKDGETVVVHGLNPNL